MKVKENRRKTMTRKMLKDALLELLQNYKLADITIKKLCETADINRSTFYLHYTDQYEVLDEILEETCESLSKYLDQNLTPASSYANTTEFLKFVKENDKRFRALLISDGLPQFEKAAGPILEKHLGRFTKNPDDQMISKYVTAYIVSGYISMVREWILSDFSLSPEAVSRMINVLFDGAVKAASAEI